MKINGLRWWVVGLVALAAVINYIDRQAFGALWPDIAKELFHISQNKFHTMTHLLDEVNEERTDDDW